MVPILKQQLFLDVELIELIRAWILLEDYVNRF